mmetsp:Transcript_14573/g.29028  ORF Transcript_14573/g.29028 Transcript_14573/m.29028 type:complete len:233 (+) Transcript_14573:255-953(+)
MAPAVHGQMVGTDLVGGIAVGYDAVGTDDGRVDWSAVHVRGGGGVDYKRRVRPALLNGLKGRQPSSLVVGPRLEDGHARHLPGRVQTPDDAQGRAVPGGSERPGVADGGEVEGGEAGVDAADGSGAVVAKGLVGGKVLSEVTLSHLLDDLGGGFGVLLPAPAQGSLELVHGVEQVHSRRPGSAQVGHLGLHGRDRRRGGREVDRQTEEGHEGDERRTADIHILDDAVGIVAI